MRIGIDARFLTHPQHGGFKTYVENLVAALARVDSENEYVLYLDRPPKGVSLPDKPNFATRVVTGTQPVIGMAWREQVGLRYGIPGPSDQAATMACQPVEFPDLDRSFDLFGHVNLLLPAVPAGPMAARKGWGNPAACLAVVADSSTGRRGKPG